MRRFISLVQGREAGELNTDYTSFVRLQADMGLQEDICRSITDSQDAAINLFTELKDNQIHILWNDKSGYPSRLKSILHTSAPPVLFVKGDLNILNEKTIGFCGSRVASESGLDITSRCAKQLVENQYTIVSGHAAGADLAAHRSALLNGGKTVFVLAEGILRFQPKREIRDLLTPNNHAVVSQFSPKIVWNENNAMKRNATIIGLSQAMILVESRKTGGTFAAGESTLKFGHPLFVIDYTNPGPSAEANPYFLKKGGYPIRGKRDRTPNLSRLFEITKSKESVSFSQTMLF